MPLKVNLDGFDPLGGDLSSNEAASLSKVFEESRKRDVQNILKSYTGTFDLFSELIQNSLDAVETRARKQEPGYTPRIWINIDIPARSVRVWSAMKALRDTFLVQHIKYLVQALQSIHLLSS